MSIMFLTIPYRRIVLSVGPIIVFSLVTVSAAMHLSRVPELGYFMIDEERDAFLVRRLLVDHRPLLVGGVIPGGISIGPLFFYLSGIPYAISRLNPIGPAYAAGVIGVLGVLGMFAVGKSLFNNRVGLLAMVFSAFSLLNIIYHRPWWPLTLGQIVTFTTYLALFRLVSRQHLDVRQGAAFQSAWFWTLVLVLVIGAQSDPSTLSLIPLSIIFLWMNRKSVTLSRKAIVGGISLFLIAHISLFVFDLRHDFQNTKAILQFFSRSPSHFSISNLKSVSTMTSSLIYRLFIPTGPLDVTKQISPCIEFLQSRMDGIWWPGAWGLLVLVGIYVISALLKGRTPPYGGVRPFQTARQLLSFHVLIAFSGILAFTSLQRGYIHEWLWSFMFPTFFLIGADSLLMVFDKVGHSVGKVRPFAVLILSFWMLWQANLFFHLQNNAGLGAKLLVVKNALGSIESEFYELRSESDPKTGSECFRYGGWRYLFTLAGNPPVKSYMDYVYEGWLYQPSSTKPRFVVNVVNPLDNPPFVEVLEASSLPQE